MKRWMEDYEPTEEVMNQLMESAPEEPLAEPERRRIQSRVMREIRQAQCAGREQCDGSNRRQRPEENGAEGVQIVDPQREQHPATGRKLARRGMPWRRRLVTAVACMAVLALGTVAFASAVMEGGLVELLGGSGDRERQIVQDMGTVLEQSQSVDGYTVALKQMINDRNGCYILMDLIRNDGQPLDQGYYMFHSTQIMIPGMECSGWYVDQPEQSDGQTNRATMILHYDGSQTLTGKTMTVKLVGLERYDVGGVSQMVTEDAWEFEVEVNDKDSTQTFALNQPVTVLRKGREETVTIKKLYLSPISLIMETGNNLESYDELDLEIRMKDGTDIDFSGNGYKSGYGLLGRNTQVDFQFDRAIDPQQIEGIWVGDTKLEL